MLVVVINLVLCDLVCFIVICKIYNLFKFLEFDYFIKCI